MPIHICKIVEFRANIHIYWDEGVFKFIQCKFLIGYGGILDNRKKFSGPWTGSSGHFVTCSLESESSTSCNSPFRERLGSNRLPDRPRPRSGSKVMERGRASPAVEILQQQSTENQCQDNNSEESIPSDPVLRSTASYAEILEAMKHPVNGVGFLTTHQSLPQCTFISSDAVSWLITHMEGITTLEQAFKMYLNMQRENLICHASGETSKTFTYGFYLYYIVQPTKSSPASEEKERVPPFCDIQSFENEWMEVEVRQALNWGVASSVPLPVPAATNEHEQGVPHFLCEYIDASQIQEDTEYPVFKRMHLDIDISNKSDRVEWGHVRYQTLFRPDQAYELVLEWLTASGSIVAELLLGWARKAQACGFQMVPIPHDPLAIPYSNKSDPLRGPIFIPLNLKCLDERDRLFKEFREDTGSERLFLLQESIACRFGFIPCLVESPNTGSSSQEHQYIHCTGTVFVLISSPAPKPRNRLTSISQYRSAGRYSVHADVVPSPHEAYITRHVSGRNKDDYDNSRRMGFLWSWNHMISRRWRTNQAVDNNFQTRLLKDFKEFCANTDNRLCAYWDECWESKETAGTNSRSTFISDALNI